jgi:hypothetical protein
LKQPIRYDTVLDIVANIVDGLTERYTKNNNKMHVPPFGHIAKQVALMDLALQAYLNDMSAGELRPLLLKLDEMCDANKNGHSTAWHEVTSCVMNDRRIYR